MRKVLLLLFVFAIGMTTFAQQRGVVSKDLRHKAVLQEKAVKGTEFAEEVVPQKSTSMVNTEDLIGTTFYDLQTNRSMQERVYLHTDGTVGGVWTRGPEGNPGGPDRGTGYNYFDGNAWGPDPTEAIEDGAQAGWPSYATWGENGEVFTSHDYWLGTTLGTRTERGTGDWNVVIQGGPSGAEDISFPRVTTTGPDNGMIHILSTTWVAYGGQEGALLYARTSDAGATWEVENETFENLGLDYTLDLGGDVYEWADPKGGLLAFLVGDNWMDMVLMKSYDDGDTWEETLIWECPFPLYSTGTTDTFYCPDGSHDLAIDNEGKVHVTFSLTRALGEDGSQSYFPGVDGVVYWNEDMPAFSDDIFALSPYGDPGSELIEDYNLIGWSQDLDGNGSIDILDEWGFYNTGLSSQPQMVVDDMNQIFVIYSSVTEGYDNGNANYRHLWVRASPNGGEWWGKFVDLNSDLIYIFDECTFPSASSSSDDNVHLIYQGDSEPDTYTTSTVENYIRYMSIPKVDLISGINEQRILSENNVSQNYPNPFNGTTTVYVTLDEPADLSLEVTNLIGQLVFELPAQRYSNGKVELNINAEGLESGVYFYTVRSGDNSITKKMIVE